MNDQSGNIDPQEIIKYLNGELDEQRAYQMEKQALNDPLLADALDGLEKYSTSAVEEDILTVQGLIIKTSRNKPAKFIWRIAVVVSLLLMASIATLFIFSKREHPTQLTHQEKVDPTEKNNKALKDTFPKDNKAINKIQNAESGKLIVKPNPSESSLHIKNDHKKPNEAKKQVQKELATNNDKIDGNGKEVIVESAKPTKESVSIIKVKPKMGKDNLTMDGEIPDSQIQPTQQEIVNLLEGKMPRIQIAKRSISGKVLDENNEPLPGANVMVKGSTNGTVTDLDGEFQINLDSLLNSTLTIAFVGYNTKEVNVRGVERIDVALDADATQLDEIVVIGYGTQMKSNLTSSVSVIHSQPEGGNLEFKKYIEENKIVPLPVIENNIKGKVVLQFEVTALGKINDIRIKKSLGFGCDEEAIRLVKQYTWIPATKDDNPIGEKVKIKIRFP